MSRYGTLVGPTLDKIIAASPALILQELGNLGTVFIGVPVAVLLGLKRESIGGAHSIAREPNVALIGDMYGLDGPEGRGAMGVYICGTVFGAIFIALLTTFCAGYLPFHPFSLAMAAGVGSASMMTASVGTLSSMYPDIAQQIQAFGAAFINAAMTKVSFMSLTTPILAYAGIAIGKDLGVFKKSGWRIVVLACAVFIGTFIGSAIIAELVLRLLGQI
jgi:hypothetical protein